MNIDWTAPFDLISPLWGTLSLNTPDGNGRIYRLNPKKCVGRRNVRATTDPVPGGDGEIFFDRYATGSEMELAIQLWDGGAIACDDVLVDMYDDLRGWLWSLLRPEDDGGRLVWTPSGKSARLLDAIRLLSMSDPEEDSETFATEITCVLDSPFPYAISLTETVVNWTGTSSMPNNGNVEFYPVFKVYGPTSGFTISGGGKSYVYDAGRPGAQSIGGGEYAEIDMFRGGLIYLNGDQDNLKPGVDVENSDILVVTPDSPNFTISGATADALMHDAWA